MRGVGRMLKLVLREGRPGILYLRPSAVPLPADPSPTDLPRDGRPRGGEATSPTEVRLAGVIAEFQVDQDEKGRADGRLPARGHDRPDRGRRLIPKRTSDSTTISGTGLMVWIKGKSPDRRREPQNPTSPRSCPWTRPPRSWPRNSSSAFPPRDIDDAFLRGAARSARNESPGECPAVFETRDAVGAPGDRPDCPK